LPIGYIPERKILSVMPADGWRALFAYRGEDDKVVMYTRPLAAWALVRRKYRQDGWMREVEGLTVGDHEGYPGSRPDFCDVVCEDMQMFVACLAPEDRIESYRTAATRGVERLEQYEADSDRLIASRMKPVWGDNDDWRDPKTGRVLSMRAAINLLNAEEEVDLTA
jgi:hypothetical protein